MKMKVQIIPAEAEEMPQQRSIAVPAEALFADRLKARQHSGKEKVDRRRFQVEPEGLIGACGDPLRAHEHLENRDGGSERRALHERNKFVEIEIP